MRNKLVARLGGNFYVDTPILVAITGVPLIWFERNEFGELMLNYRLRTGSVITNNSWEVPQDQLQEVICKPGGRSLDVRHTNGDRFAVTYTEHVDRGSFAREHLALEQDAIPLGDNDFPITVVALTSVSSAGTFQLHPGWTSLPSGTRLKDHWFFGNRIGLELAHPSLPAGFSSSQLEALAAVRKSTNNRRSGGRDDL